MSRTIVFFDGNGCISKVCKKMGDDTKALDILPLPNIDLLMDIMCFEPRLLGNWIPDKLWFSPPCETYSMITARKGGGNLYYQTIKNNGRVVNIYPRQDFESDKRFKKLSKVELEKLKLKVSNKRNEHALFVRKSIEIIEYYLKLNPKLIWFIENPTTGLMRYYLKGKLNNMIENKTTYCMYGSEYRKETSIFSNMKLDLKFCPKHKKGVVDLCGGHSDSLVQRYDDKKQPKGVVKKSTYLERSSIPTLLAEDILYQTEKHFSF